MKLKAAFIFLTKMESGADSPAEYRNWTRTPAVDLLSIGVATYAQAVAAAQKAVNEEGCACIELCGGFGVQAQPFAAQA